MGNDNDLVRIEKKIDIKFDTVTGQFNTLNETLRTMGEKITTHKVKIENCEDEKEGLKQTLYGNGKDGLVLEVDRIKTTLKTTGIIKRSVVTNVIGAFVCVGVAASIVLGIISYNHSKIDDMKLVKRIVEIEKFLE